MDRKPGDWNCPFCDHLNFSRRDSCKHCARPRPLPERATTRDLGSGGGRSFALGGRSDDVRPGDWYCDNCNTHNFASQRGCYECGAFRDVQLAGDRRFDSPAASDSAAAAAKNRWHILPPRRVPVLSSMLTGSTKHDSSSLGRQRIEFVRARLLEDSKKSDEDPAPRRVREDHSIGKVSCLKTFSKIVESHGLIADLISGEIILRETPRKPHGAAQFEVSRQLGLQGGGMIYISNASDIVSRVAPNTTYVPDVILSVERPSSTPNAMAPGESDYPSVIVEIGSSQDASDLHNRASFFLGPDSPGTEVYIAIKRYDPRISEAGNQALICAVYDRVAGIANPRLISFGSCSLHRSAYWSMHAAGAITGVGYGGPDCNAPNIPDYVIQLPTNRIFASTVGGVPVGLPPNFTLDLFLVRTALFRNNSSH